MLYIRSAVLFWHWSLQNYFTETVLGYHMASLVSHDCDGMWTETVLVSGALELSRSASMIAEVRRSLPLSWSVPCPNQTLMDEQRTDSVIAVIGLVICQSGILENASYSYNYICSLWISESLCYSHISQHLFNHQWRTKCHRNPTEFQKHHCTWNTEVGWDKLC